jgi:hypothetical protein
LAWLDLPQEKLKETDVSANGTDGQRRRFTVGWVMLLAAAALMTLNHSILSLVLDEPILFLGYAAFNLYALLVIALPLRRREQWAWYTTWLLPLGLAFPGAMDPDIAPLYYGAAAVCVAGLLLSMGELFAAGHGEDRNSNKLNSPSNS